MANLKSNGSEIVRFRRTLEDKHFPSVLEYSLRSNGWVLKKVKLTTGWSGWTRAWKYAMGTPDEQMLALRRRLERHPVKGCTVEEVTA